METAVLTCPKCSSKDVIKRGLIQTENRESTQRYGCINSAQTLMKGYEIYYNWIRKNIALKGQTPSQIAVPNVQIENKNGWLELIQRGYNGK